MRCEVLRDAEALAGLAPEWEALWRASATKPVNLAPAWVLGWWRAFGGDGELQVVTCRVSGVLAGVAPFYLVPPRGGALRARELKLAGDGVVSARAAVLALAGEEQAVREAAAGTLCAERGWDLLDLTLADGAEVAALAAAFVGKGRTVDEGPPGEAQGRPVLELDARLAAWLDARLTRSAAAWSRCDGEELTRAIGMLGPLVAAAGAGAAPHGAGEPAFQRFLELVVPPLHALGAASLFVARAGDRLGAARLVLGDGPRWIELCDARAAGPAHDAAADAVLRASIEAAHAAGAARYEFAAAEAPLATAVAGGARLRVFGATAAGVLQRGYAQLVRTAGAIADAAVRAPIDRLDRTAERLRGAPDVVQRVVAQVATFARLHLYRGELFVRGGAPPPGVTLALFSERDFNALPAEERAALVDRLGLAVDYARQKWTRGDTVVLASLDGKPAGIVWCARATVHVPDIGREVRPLPGECYIHDVYVQPEARGRALAPAMLDFLARELRGRDIYRAWALIERSNVASTRAFEKAAYASVADVIYARMARASKLLVRPPDPEARRFLGLPPRRKG